MMDRRGFLRVLGLGATTAAGVQLGVLEPATLWTPTRRTYFDIGQARRRQLLFLDEVTLETLRLLKNRLEFTSFVNRDYSYRYEEMKVGERINVRLPRRYWRVDHAILDRQVLEQKEREAVAHELRLSEWTPAQRADRERLKTYEAAARIINADGAPPTAVLDLSTGEWRTRA